MSFEVNNPYTSLLFRGKADVFLLQIINMLYGFCSVSMIKPTSLGVSYKHE